MSNLDAGIAVRGKVVRADGTLAALVPVTLTIFDKEESGLGGLLWPSQCACRRFSPMARAASISTSYSRDCRIPYRRRTPRDSRWRQSRSSSTRGPAMPFPGKSCWNCPPLPASRTPCSPPLRWGHFPRRWWRRRAWIAPCCAISWRQIRRGWVLRCPWRCGSAGVAPLPES